MSSSIDFLRGASPLFMKVKLPISLFALVLLLSNCARTEEVKTKATFEILTETIEVNQPTDIISLSDTLVRPILYSHIVNLDVLPISIKKDKFISALLPAILVAKLKLKRQAMRLALLEKSKDWTVSDSLFIDELKFTYKKENYNDLMNALNTHPNSIILAQAAVESGWGNSRIFSESNNLFGIWSFNKNEPRIASNVKRGDKTIYLRQYENIEESIKGYFITIGRTNAYQGFRDKRAQTDDPFDLINDLSHYSELREEYVAQLSTVIRFNKLTKYDTYQIDPKFIVD